MSCGRGRSRSNRDLSTSSTAGNGGRISVVIDGFEKIRSPIYGGLTTPINSGHELRWVTMDVQMWAGHSAYFEIADGAVVDFGGATSQCRRRPRLDRRRRDPHLRPPVAVRTGAAGRPIDRADNHRPDRGDRSSAAGRARASRSTGGGRGRSRRSRPPDSRPHARAVSS